MFFLFGVIPSACNFNRASSYQTNSSFMRDSTLARKEASAPPVTIPLLIFRLRPFSRHFSLSISGQFSAFQSFYIFLIFLQLEFLLLFSASYLNNNYCNRRTLIRFLLHRIHIIFFTSSTGCKTGSSISLSLDSIRSTF